MNKILSETNKEREKSCGCIIINKNKVLLIKQTKGHWGFPKGHVEKDETEIETAIREVKEETVRKAFLKGNCEVLVILEDSDREILIDDFSPDEDIKKYLGAKFINHKR